MSTADATNDLKVMLGDPRKAILAMAGPLIVSFLVVQINSFADTTWCSLLGVEPNSAVSTIIPVYWIVAGIGTGLGVGASTAIARYLGRGDKDTADSLVTQTVATGIVLSLVLLPLIFLLLDGSISFMGADDVRGLCREYIDPIVILGLGIVMNEVVAGILRAEGAARRSTVMLLTAALLNIVLDPVFMFGLDMGIAGAGLATAVSAIASTSVGLFWFARGSVYLRMSFRGFRFKTSQIREILVVGVPRATESFLISFMSMVQRIFVVICAGTVGVLLYNSPWRFVTLAQVVSQATGSALIPIGSAALGQRDVARAAEANRYAIKLTMSIMIAIAALLFVFADYAVIPFTLSESMAELRPMLAHVLRIYAVLIPFMGLIDIGSSILQSLRLAQMSMVLSFLRNLFLVAMLFFSHSISLDALFYSVLATEIVGGASMIGVAMHEFRKHAADAV